MAISTTTNPFKFELMSSIALQIFIIFFLVSCMSCLPNPPWSSKEKIAFSLCTEKKADDECSSDIYMMDHDGKNKSRLTNTKDDNKMPRWSKDGYKLAFMSDRGGKDKIYVMKFDKSSYCRWGNCWITRLTTTPNNSREQFPNWHPKNDTLIFQSIDSSGTIKLATANFDSTTDFLHSTETSGVININPPIPGYPKFPSWSPNGSRIAFVSEMNGEETIFIAKADGTESYPITKPDFDSTLPVWAPNGRSIAFASNRDGDFDIYIVNPDGTDLKKITANIGNELEPSWSPDSKKVVYTADSASTSKHPYSSREIFIVNIFDKKMAPKRITHNSIDESYPAWAPKFED